MTNVLMRLEVDDVTTPGRYFEGLSWGMLATVTGEVLIHLTNPDTTIMFARTLQCNQENRRGRRWSIRDSLQQYSLNGYSH